MDTRSFRYFVRAVPALLACAGVYGQPVYAVDIYNNAVTVIDSATNNLVTTIPNFIQGIPNSFSAGPCNVAVTPDGTQAFVSNYIHSIGAYPQLDVVTAIDTKTNKLTTIPIDQSLGTYHLAISPDSKYLYVPLNTGQAFLMLVIDTTMKTIVRRFGVNGSPGRMALTNDGKQLWVPYLGNTKVDVFDTASGNMLNRFDLGSLVDAVVFSPAGTTAYVSSEQVPTIFAINVASGTVTDISASLPGAKGYPAGFADLAISPDGNRLYTVQNPSPSNNIEVIDLVNPHVFAPLPEGAAGDNVEVPFVISANGQSIFAVDVALFTVSIAAYDTTQFNLIGKNVLTGLNNTFFICGMATKPPARQGSAQGGVPRDFRGIGISDEVLYDPLIGQEYTALSNSDGTYTYVPNLFTPGFDTLRTGDFNGDGKADLVLYNSKTALAYLGLGNGDGTFNFQSLFWSPGYDIVEMGDIDGDGKTDVALYNSTTGTLYTGISNGAGGFTYLYHLVSAGYTFVRLSDFTGDGKADIFLYDSDTGLANLGVGDGTGAFTFKPLFISAGFNVDDIGDLSGDGKTDLILYNRTSGFAATGLSIGAGNFMFIPITFTPGFTSVVLADYSGGVLAGVTLYNSVNGAAYFGTGNSLGGFNFQSLFWSRGYDWVVAEDVNGDGKSDVILYDSATGTEYTGLSNGNGTFNYVYKYWGTGKVLAR